MNGHSLGAVAVAAVAIVGIVALVMYERGRTTSPATAGITIRRDHSGRVVGVTTDEDPVAGLL